MSGGPVVAPKLAPEGMKDWNRTPRACGRCHQRKDPDGSRRLPVRGVMRWVCSSCVEAVNAKGNP